MHFQEINIFCFQKLFPMLFQFLFNISGVFFASHVGHQLLHRTKISPFIYSEKLLLLPWSILLPGSDVSSCTKCGTPCSYYKLINQRSHQEEEEMVVAFLQANCSLSLTTLYYLKKTGNISSCNCGDQNRYLKPNHNVSFFPNQVVFGHTPNQNISTLLWQERNRKFNLNTFAT